MTVEINGPWSVFIPGRRRRVVWTTVTRRSYSCPHHDRATPPAAPRRARRPSGATPRATGRRCSCAAEAADRALRHRRRDDGRRRRARPGSARARVFRRFDSREGLMAALLNHSETEWQASVISGPPPLGPGAEPMERLLAFGRSRLEHDPAARRPDPRGRAGRHPRATRRTRSSRCTCATCWASSASPATSPLLADGAARAAGGADPRAAGADRGHPRRPDLRRAGATWSHRIIRAAERRQAALPAQPEGEPVDERAPGRLDDVVRRRRR